MPTYGPNGAWRLGPPTLAEARPSDQTKAMVPFGLLAKIEMNPAAILRDPWAHEMAHEFFAAKLTLECEHGVLQSHGIRQGARRL